MKNTYKRVLLKLSGEALKGNSNSILDSFNINEVSKSIKLMVDRGVEVAVVVGAGNIWRGKLAESIGIERSQADYMGMLGTIINALALQSALQNQGIDARVMTSIEMERVAEQYVQRKAIHHLEKKRVVIFGGGTGNPFFTTDTTAALRALETKCDAIFMAKNGVDGVYSSDPKKDKNAKKFNSLTFKEMLQLNLSVMDNTAVSLCLDSDLELKVFSMQDTSNFKKVLDGEDIGTTIKKGD